MFLFVDLSWFHFHSVSESSRNDILSMEPTYPTWGKGKASSKVP